MVREFTELQGTMGGIYGREEGLPEAVWKAIYFHYMPVGVEADAPPSRQQLGAAGVNWAAVSLADKLDSVVGMFSAGERPTGSRDPLALRRQAQGIVKILVDLPELTGLSTQVTLGALLLRAAEPFGGYTESRDALFSFLLDRVRYLLEQRGFDVRSVRAVTHIRMEDLSPLTALRKVTALDGMSGSDALLGVATLLKRVKNITKGAPLAVDEFRERLNEPEELALTHELDLRRPAIQAAAEQTDYREAFSQIAQLQPVVSTFFDKVLVMTDDESLRTARLALLTGLRELILDIADISEIATERS
jgi:glycyl-tRNA synthetase beta chain